MPLNPREVTNNFRSQPLVEEAAREANALVESKPETELSVSELADLVLAYLEVPHWVNAEKYASLILAAEQNNPSPLNENKATALYALAVHKRELNFCDEALKIFKQAQQLAESDWLKSNILRNFGLVYLKPPQNFQAAYEAFQSAYKLALYSTDVELRGSLPALLNYSALARCRIALTKNEYPAAGLALFKEASELYETVFTEKGIHDEVARRRSNDYISHCVHRGMIECEISEQHLSEDPTHLQTSENLLLEALQSRKENKVDGQRLGDVCVWLGRVCAEKEQRYNREALTHYRTALPENAKQIRDVKDRISAAQLPKHSSFRPVDVTPARALQDNLRPL